jgi:DNA-binding NtrC family response regulator
MENRKAGRKHWKVVSVVETLLLVDGDAATRNAMKFLLEVSGYRVVEATRGIEATQALEEFGDRIHMALVAADLPDMGGPEWQGFARFLAPGLPVLILGERDRLEAAMTPVGPWFGGLPALSPYPTRLLEKIRLALDEHFFSQLDRAAAAA